VTEPLVTLEATESATIIRLNRPARHNALVPELLQELRVALDDQRSQDASAIVLAAEGRSFSTGGDLLGFWQHRERIADYAHRLVGLLNEAVLALYTHPAPVACAVHGQVTGGSLGLLLGADRVIMQRDACIAPWYTKVGFSPDGGWNALLPDIIGEQQASKWLTNDDPVSANACLAMGIAHEVVADNVVEAALAWSHRIAAAGAASIRSAGSLRGRSAADVNRGLEAERSAFVQQVQTPEAIAGIAHFLGKELH
jgi:2-(1,2-epoxy-1,2-dihydrophenyl)acetyl-CoA isomerase